MQPTFIVSNRTGGQGKTLVSQLLVLGFAETGVDFAIAAADTVGSGATSSGASKIGKFFPGRVLELGIGLTLAEVRAQGPKAIAYWDKFGRLLLEGGTLIDVGANVSPAIWDWAQTTNVGQILRRRQAPPIHLVVPVRPQAQAVEDAVALLEHSVAAEEAMPIASRVLVFNELGGTFTNYGTGEDIRRVESLKRTRGLRIARIGACHSELWPIIERSYIPFETLLDMDPETIEQQFGLDPFVASRGQVDLIRWLNECLDNFRAVGLLPPRAPTAGSSPAE